MKKHLPVISLILMAVVGFSLLLYPIVSRYINSFNQSKSVAHYAEAITKYDKNTLSYIKSTVNEYNDKLKKDQHSFISGKPVSEEYKSILSMDKDGMMGYISIDKIGAQMPIYHGTSEDVLSNGIGHLEGSSLPMGGTGTHCVLTGHRGVPGAELFTNLDKLEVGDIFTITVLDEVLTYEVIKISIVDPTDDTQLMINKNADYTTLFTCTPYAVNTHRLLILGSRIKTETSAHKITADAVMVDSNIVALSIGIPIIILLIAVIIIKNIIAKYLRKRHKGIKHACWFFFTAITNTSLITLSFSFFIATV